MGAICALFVVWENFFNRTGRKEIPTVPLFPRYARLGPVDIERFRHNCHKAQTLHTPQTASLGGHPYGAPEP